MKRIDQRFEIVQRLYMAVEHVNVVTHMVESDNCCEQMLQQIRTAQEELHRAGCSLLALQKYQCETIIRDDPNPEIRLAELARLQEIYKVMTHCHYLNYEVNHE